MVLSLKKLIIMVKKIFLLVTRKMERKDNHQGPNVASVMGMVTWLMNVSTS